MRLKQVAMGMLFAFAATGAMASDNAATPTTDAQRADVLADHLVQMMPLGAVLDGAAKDDPRWPMQDKAGKVTPAQLACLRSELSSTGYRRSRGRAATEYVAAHAARYDDEAKLMAQISPMVGRIFASGMTEANGGKATDAEAMLKQSDPATLMGFMAFISEAKYADLRDLTGLGDAFNMTASAEANAKSGEAVGQKIVVKLMLGAMDTCQVPSSVLFD